jgi:DNA mismatch repair ATPase MutL
MARTIKSLDELRPNIFEAIKRAYIKRGIVPRRYHSKDVEPTSDSTSAAKAAEEDQSAPAQSAKSSTEPKGQTDESYPERVAEGESDSTIESEGNEHEKSDRKLKSGEQLGSKTAKGPETLPEITEKSQDILYEANTVFPFTLVPDTITLDREKLTIANRMFWRMANITSVPVGEIMSAEVIVGPFFGSLHLTFRFFANNERTINFLPRKDAIELQRLIHGYIIAHRREIDVTSISKDELVKLLTELGHGASD